MSLSYAVFCSPSVKKGGQLSLLHEAFKHVGLSAKFYPVQDCQKLAPTLKAEVLVAAGGDGTVNTVANQAHKLNKSLGIVPLGTLNHLAKDISLPPMLLQAVEIIAKGSLLKIDIGMVNDQIFLNNCSIGLYPALVRSRTRLEKYIGKWPATLVSVLSIASRRPHIYKITMVIDGKVVKKRSSLLFAGNNVYDLEGVGAPSRDTLLDGKLNVFILKTKRVDRLVKTALHGFLGKDIPKRYLEHHDTKKLEVEVDAQKKVWVAYDGEVEEMTSPISFQLLPKELAVITTVTY